MRIEWEYHRDIMEYNQLYIRGTISGNMKLHLLGRRGMGHMMGISPTNEREKENYTMMVIYGNINGNMMGIYIKSPHSIYCGNINDLGCINIVEISPCSENRIYN